MVACKDNPYMPPDYFQNPNPKTVGESDLLPQTTLRRLLRVSPCARGTLNPSRSKHSFSEFLTPKKGISDSNADFGFQRTRCYHYTKPLEHNTTQHN